jgi:beta-fructofuranosidase
MHRDASGLYHMYYQYNPLTPVAGNQHWGHATSRDLYTWENQKIAIFPPNNYTVSYPTVNLSPAQV